MHNYSSVDNARGKTDDFFSVGPRIMSTPQDKEVNEREHASFRCDAVGNPSPTIFWTRAGDDQIIAKGEVFVHQIPRSYGVESRLTIQGLKESDFGIYNCTANNGLGADQKGTLLRMKGVIDVFEDGILKRKGQNSLVRFNTTLVIYNYNFIFLSFIYPIYNKGLKSLIQLNFKISIHNSWGHVSDKENLDKVYREIEVLKTLNHPYIIKLYQVSSFNVMETKNMIYLITEYAPNGEIYDQIARQHRLTEEDRILGSAISIQKNYCYKRFVDHHLTQHLKFLKETPIMDRMLMFGPVYIKRLVMIVVLYNVANKINLFNFSYEHMKFYLKVNKNNKN
uniref:Ig-like domain-containing protein n=1 Tax=Heterorhabditis bacteriophora TaxID=37862 RepID=A0A1I7WEK3_HETBA